MPTETQPDYYLLSKLEVSEEKTVLAVEPAIGLSAANSVQEAIATEFKPESYAPGIDRTQLIFTQELTAYQIISIAGLIETGIEAITDNTTVVSSQLASGKVTQPR